MCGKSKEEAMEFAKEQLGREMPKFEDKKKMHYGKMEIKELLDFIYEAPELMAK